MISEWEAKYFRVICNTYNTLGATNDPIYKYFPTSHTKCRPWIVDFHWWRKYKLLSLHAIVLVHCNNNHFHKSKYLICNYLHDSILATENMTVAALKI